MSTILAEKCSFSYRDSEFKRAWRGRYAIVEVAFRLARGGAPAVRYAELARALEGKPATIAEVRRKVLALRASKSMVVSPDDENRRSAGSFFTNPIVAGEVAPRIEARARELGALREGETMPVFDAGPGRTKLSAAWLIERSGLARGTARGRVGLSTKHTLAVVNRGGATAREIVEFACFVRDHVAATFDVRLSPEPELVGFSSGELDGLVGVEP
jgi:UDP-N-acetylmuramate dehydrogenase